MKTPKNSTIAIITAIFLLLSGVGLSQTETVQNATFFGGGPGTINQLSQWKNDGTNITQNVASTTVKITGLESEDCIGTDADGVLQSGNCAGSSGTVTSVDMSVPTGLAISGNPITTSGTLALALDTGYVIPLTASTTDWQTAFGWGNHASAGYLTTVDISDNTNLTGDTEIVLTGDALSIASTIARDTELHSAVTLSGALDYLTLAGQVITRGLIDLTTDITGVLPNANVADDITLTNLTQITNRAISDTTGTLAVARGGTGVTTSTGSGSVVLSTSPTLVTPILGTPTSVTLTNATGLPVSTGISGLGTGVATALGINIGTAGSFITNGGALGTPSSGTLTNATGLPIVAGTTGTLSVARGGTGATTLTGLLLGNGTSAFTATTTLSSSYIADDYVLNTGDSISGNLTFSGTSANIALGSNYLSGDGGDEGVFVSSTGNVGIGTTNPGTPLHVFTGLSGFTGFSDVTNGSIAFGNSNASDPSPTIYGRSNSVQGLRLIGLTSDSNTTGDINFDARENDNTNFATLTSSAFRFTRFGTDLVNILRNGNVGIGTTTPATPLQVAAAGNVQLRLGDGTGGFYFNLGRDATDGVFKIQGNNGSAQNIALAPTSGNVGIGTSTPDSRLEVQGASSGTILELVSNTGSKFLSMLNTGVTTLLGSWDFGGADFLEIPNGTNPTANDPGEIAHDTTDNQLIVDDFVMGSAVEKIWSTTIASTSPAFIDAGLVPIPTYIDGYTITRIQCHVTGGTSKIIAVEDASGNSSEDVTCGTSNTTDDGSITNATYTASELSYIDFGSTSGSVNYVSVSVFGTITRE